MKLMYKMSKSVLPCVLLTLCIGFCYAFSLFAPHVSEHLGATRMQVQFAFCLNIFFLGMGAAFFGKYVEKDINMAALFSASALLVGLIVAGVSMCCRDIYLFYVGMGVFCGVAEGCGYVVPVKNLLLWFGKSRRKGVIAAVSIITFGLGSTICTWLFALLFPVFGIDGVFFALAVVYFFPSFAAAFMIDKPRYAKLALKKNPRKYAVSGYLKDGFFLQSWLFMFLNIAAGLVLIGSCAGILAAAGYSNAVVVTVMALCGVFNGGGRLAFPFFSDYLRDRKNIWLILLGIEIAVMVSSVWIPALLPAAMVMCNATYGAGFATLPSVLSDHYGNSELSFVHGLVLSAWGMASLLAFVITSFLLAQLSGWAGLFQALGFVYVINYANVWLLKRRPKP